MQANMNLIEQEYSFLVLRDDKNNFYIPAEETLLGPFNLKEIDSRFVYRDHFKNALERLKDKNPFAAKFIKELKTFEVKVLLNLKEVKLE